MLEGRRRVVAVESGSLERKEGEGGGRRSPLTSGRAQFPMTSP